jgi:hypothetical protein
MLSRGLQHCSTGQVDARFGEVWVTCGVKMMLWCNCWGWWPPRITSYIHIQNIQSVWAISMMSQGHMGFADCCAHCCCFPGLLPFDMVVWQHCWSNQWRALRLRIHHMLLTYNPPLLDACSCCCRCRWWLALWQVVGWRLCIFNCHSCFILSFMLY